MKAWRRRRHGLAGSVMIGRFLVITFAVVVGVLLPSGRAVAYSPIGTPEAGLDVLVREIESVLPESWRVVESGTGQLPIGWTGPATGLYVEVEDTSTRFFHPNGFHYYSFYRVWLMPPDWEGEMRETPYVIDSSPAFLLGMSERRLALYHTAGANVWGDGPAAFCSALGLDYISYSDLSRRVVDLEIEEQLTDSVSKGDEPAFEMSPYRIVGLAGAGPGLYMEYVFGSDEADGSRLEDVTAQLAGSVFEHFPEVVSLYLRRCKRDTFTDTIVTRN